MLFFILFLSFVFGWSTKVSRKIRKSSLIFGCPRVSLCVSGLTADHYFWCSRVFLAVLRVFRVIMGCYGVLWDVPGVFRSCSGLFRAVPGVFRGCSGVFRGVPGCSGCVPGFTDTLTLTVLIKLHRETWKIVNILIPFWVYYSQCILHSNCILFIASCSRSIIHHQRSTCGQVY